MSNELNYHVPEHVQGLLRTLTEMMTGSATQENLEIVLQWAVYMHARSVMPPLVQHWNQVAPEEAAKVKEAIKTLQQLNEQWKASRQQKQQEAQAVKE